MGETQEAQRLPHAAGGRAADGLAARRPLIPAAISRCLADTSGATAVEYGLIVAFIFLVIVGAVSVFAGNTSAKYTYISNAITSATTH